MESKLTFRNFYKHPRFWRHLIFWIIYAIFVIVNVLVFDMSNTSKDEEEGWLTFMLFNVQLVFMIYGSFYAYNNLIPKRKYLYFVLSVLVIIVVASLFDDLMDVSAVQIGILKGFWANLIIYPIIIGVGLGIKLAYNGAKQILLIDKLRAKQTESELKLLKSQVNPHFLFNTLNNIYSTNLDDHERANDIILELADLLRYQLESNRNNETSLRDEINSLENYVSLEKIRVKDCDVQIEKSGNFSSAEIVPLLLLPFVENAFKYGTGIERGEISIKFDLDEKKIFHFNCKNKIVQKKGRIHSGGIGLENVKKRLEMMYYGNYELDIKELDGFFVVDLKLKL